MIMQYWFDSHNNKLLLARYLKEKGEWNNAGNSTLPDGKVVEDDPISRLLYFFEKPWKFDDEWEEFQNYLMKE